MSPKPFSCLLAAALTIAAPAFAGEAPADRGFLQARVPSVELSPAAQSDEARTSDEIVVEAHRTTVDLSEQVQLLHDRLKAAIKSDLKHVAAPEPALRVGPITTRS